MDYPFYRRQRYDISNNWWFLPSDLFKAEQDHRPLHRTHPIVSYMYDISNKNRFKYMVIIIIIIVFIYHLDLRASIWIGLFVALVIVYYLNEMNEYQIHDEADQMWAILKGPLLKNTKYFITYPPLIRWVDNVGEFKKYNVLVFNQMITTLDQMLRSVYDIKRGVHYCSENLDIIRDLKTSSLNQFHSIIHNISIPNLRRKFNFYLKELGKLLNIILRKQINVCQTYYIDKPIDIESHFNVTKLGDPLPDDPLYEDTYNFYN
jgi:hypothetical protein